MREVKRIIHCDRCKKEIKDIENHKYYIELDRYDADICIKNRQYKLFRWKRNDYGKFNWEDGDLCDDCKKSFLNWWRGKVDGESKNR